MSRDEVLIRLAEREIETRPIWSPLHKMPMYANAERAKRPRIGFPNRAIM